MCGMAARHHPRPILFRRFDVAQNIVKKRLPCNGAKPRCRIQWIRRLPVLQDIIGDGKKLVFSSNRNNGGTRDTNLFIADWVE